MRRTLASAAIASAICSACAPAIAKAGVDAQPLVTRQSDEQFQAAVRNDSTAPSFVLVTIVNGNTGERRTGCLTANLLLGAIHIEYELDYKGASIAEAKRLALENHDRVFTFKNPKALENVPFDPIRGARACEIVRRGKPAYEADITGAVREGQP